MGNINSWLNIGPTSGQSGETQLSLTALTNSSLSAKTATITARNTTYNVSDTTTVTIQGFVPTLTLSRSTLRFDSTGGTATFTVYSNTAWTINFPALVHSYSTSAGTGDTEVTVVLAPNPDEVAKIDTGIVKDVYNVNQLFLTIVQESFIVELYVVPDDDIVFANTGSTTSVTIDSNADWELVYPSWVVPSVTTGASGTTTVIFTAGENGPTDRSGEINVYAGGKSVTINVSQPKYIPAYITVTPSAYTYPFSASSAQFVVDSFPEWTAEVISTGETHWGEDIAFKLVMEISANTTVPLKQTGVIVNGVILQGTDFTPAASGTYSFLYPYTGNTMPVFYEYYSSSGSVWYENTTLREVEIYDLITTVPQNTFRLCKELSSVTIGSACTSIGQWAFRGCSKLAEIEISAPIAPSLHNDACIDIRYDGVLRYPSGSDYSSWLSLEKNYLGYYNWNNTAIDSAFIAARVYYDVSSTTESTVLANTETQGIYAFRTDNGVIRRMVDNYESSYKFNSTGTHYVEFLGLPDSVTGKRLIISGTSATEIIVPDDAQSQVITLNANCSGLTAITVNRNCEIGRTTFNNVLVYRVGGSTTTVPATANAYSYSAPFLEEVIVTTTGNTVFSDYCFARCTALTSVTVTCPANVEFGQYCFSGATSLPTVSLPAGPTSFGYMCFVEAKGLTGFTSTESITGVGEYCFRYCESLESFTWPTGATGVAKLVFQFCTGLTSVTFPSTVTGLGRYCFYECSNLHSITSLATTAPSTESRTFNNFNNNGVLYYPAGSDYSTWLNRLGSGWTGQEI